MKCYLQSFQIAGVPPAIGHYSHIALLPNGSVLVAGQKAWIDEAGTIAAGGLAAQTRVALANTEKILAAAGLAMSCVVKISCHLANINDYDEFNDAYRSYLGDHKPVRTVLGGYSLRGGALVELVSEGFRQI